MEETRTLQVATYSYEDGTDEGPAGGYLQLWDMDGRDEGFSRWLLTAMRMGQTKAQLVAKYSYRPWMGQMKTLQVATYSYEDGTEEDSAGGHLQL